MKIKHLKINPNIVIWLWCSLLMVNLTESRINWEMGLWACLWGIKFTEDPRQPCKQRKEIEQHSPIPHLAPHRQLWKGCSKLLLP